MSGSCFNISKIDQEHLHEIKHAIALIDERDLKNLAQLALGRGSRHSYILNFSASHYIFSILPKKFKFLVARISLRAMLVRTRQIAISS
jgi:hypothetical protein